MPELPEVETVTSGLNFAIKNLIVKKVLVKRYDLRIKVSDQITSVLNNIKVTKVTRRAKFGIIHFENKHCLTNIKFRIFWNYFIRLFYRIKRRYFLVIFNSY